jgi:hypothetical protein
LNGASPLKSNQGTKAGNINIFLLHFIWHSIFDIKLNFILKRAFTLLLIIGWLNINAQKIDSIYVNLYTDSLKKGTYNYINVDGLFSNGKYLPLDSSTLKFSSSAGKFFGNSLWIDSDCKAEKIDIEIVLKTNPLLHKKFTIYIKKKDDDELKSMEEVMKGN